MQFKKAIPRGNHYFIRLHIINMLVYVEIRSVLYLLLDIPIGDTTAIFQIICVNI